MLTFVGQSNIDPTYQRLLEQWPVYASYLAAGLTVLLTLWYSGLLQRDTFNDAPPRKAGLAFPDLFIGGWLLLGCSVILVRPAFHLAGVKFNLDGEPVTAGDAAVAALVGQLVTQLPVVLFILFRLRRTAGGMSQFGLVTSRPDRDMLAGGMGVLAALPLTAAASAVAIIVSLLLHHEVPQVGHRMLQQMMASDDGKALAMMMGSAVLVAPVLEEIIFRGLVQTTLLHWTTSQGEAKRWSIIIIAAGIFAAIHAGAAQPHTMPALFVLGLVLGWLYEYSGSLLPCVLLHMAFNVFNIVLSFAGMGK